MTAKMKRKRENLQGENRINDSGKMWEIGKWTRLHYYCNAAGSHGEGSNMKDYPSQRRGISPGGHERKQTFLLEFGVSTL